MLHYLRSQNTIFNKQMQMMFSTYSRRQNTPRVIKNPRLTLQGITPKKKSSYDYDLPPDLPNRHLYWDRTKENKRMRSQYNQRKLKKLQIKSIHDEQGNRLFNRELPELISEMTSLNVIKGSVNRTMANVFEAIQRFPNQFIGTKQGKKLERGPSYDVLAYVINQLEKRHLAAMSFLLFNDYCVLRKKAHLPPTEAILIHFFKFLQGCQAEKSDCIPLIKVGHLARYIFSRQYPATFNQLFYRKQIEFDLFTEAPPENRSFEHVIPNLYTSEYLQKAVKQLKPEQSEKVFQAIGKMPGGKSLVQKAKSYQ